MSKKMWKSIIALVIRLGLLGLAAWIGCSLWIYVIGIIVSMFIGF